jgi:Fe-coproporphyrin III synthase
MNSSRISLYIAGLQYALNNAVSGREYPFIGGIVITDRCNLHCRHCFVSGRNIPDLSFQEVISGLTSLYKMGLKNLYIEGGEPFLWRDGDRTLRDVIGVAREIGFRYIALYTNGTFPVETKADIVFVSLDGLKDVHDFIRGKSFERIIFNIRQSTHRKILVNYTITKKNLHIIEEFLKEMEQVNNIKGTFFYLYTPSKGADELYLSKSDKKKTIENILYLKSKGYKIVNSKSALLSVYNDTWKKPTNLNYIFAENRIFTCCRDFGNEKICRDCGYLGFAEIYKISRFNLNAILSAMKYY